MNEPLWDDRLTQRKVTLTLYQGDGLYWKLVAARYLDEQEARGRHTIFVEVLDGDDERVVGHPVTFFWEDDGETRPSEAKPGEDHALDFPMYAAGNAYGIRIDPASDIVFGMGLGTVERPDLGIHVCYHLTFRYTSASEPPKPPPAPADWQEVLRLAETIQRIAQRNLGRG